MEKICPNRKDCEAEDGHGAKCSHAENHEHNSDCEILCGNDFENMWVCVEVEE